MKTKEGETKVYGWSNLWSFTVDNGITLSGKQKPEIEEYGPAMLLYFRHLKLSIVFTLLCCISNSVLISIYNQSHHSTSADTFSSSGNLALVLQDVSLATSIAGYSSSASRFYQANFQDISTLSSSLNNLTSSNSNPNEVSLDCGNGLVDTDSRFTVFGLLDQRFPSSYTYYMIVKSANNETNFYNDISSCTNKSSCKVNYTSNWFTDAATDYITGAQSKRKYKFYLRYHCTGIKFELSTGTSTSKSSFIATIFSLNILNVVFFVLYMTFWVYYEKKIFKKYRDEGLMPSDYTIQIRNLPQNMKEEELKTELYNHLKKFKDELKIRSEEPIVDINVAKTSNLLYIDQQIQFIDTRTSLLVEKLIADHAVPQPPGDGVLDLKFILGYLKSNSQAHLRKDSAVDFESLLLLMKGKKMLEKRRREMEKEKQTFSSVFVTFNVNKNKVKYYNALNISNSTRFFFFICKKKQRGADDISMFRDNILSVKDPVEPINITWSNLQISRLEKRVRRSASLLFTIMLVVLPVVLVATVNNFITQLGDLKISCPDHEIFSPAQVTANPNISVLVVQDYLRGANSEKLIYCYCLADLNNRYNQYFIRYLS